jgi:hypothetical protein
MSITQTPTDCDFMVASFLLGSLHGIGSCQLVSSTSLFVTFARWTGGSNFPSPTCPIVHCMEPTIGPTVQACWYPTSCPELLIYAMSIKLPLKLECSHFVENDKITPCKILENMKKKKKKRRRRRKSSLMTSFFRHL